MRIHSLYTEEYWSGCRNKTIDPFEYGDYKVEVHHISGDILLFSYTYTSLFTEYLFTDAGKYESRSFEETVRMPFPKQSVSITFYKRNKQTMQWQEELQLLFKPDNPQNKIQAVESHAFVKKLNNAGPPEHNIDIALIAEGYTMSEQAKFIQDAEKIAEYLLKCKPFLDFREKINIWAVFAPSDESGVTDPSENQQKNTVLGCNFSTFGTDRYLMTDQHFTLRNIAAGAPYDHLIIIVNSDKYGGGGIYNFYATCTSDNSATNFLVIHEFGHSFAGLADEYWTSDVSVNDYYNPSTEPVEPNITTLVDFQSKWKDLVDENTPIPTPNERNFKNIVGVFEGGGYSEKGIYRPYLDCTMKSVKYNSFCPVCRQAIEQAIEYYSE